MIKKFLLPITRTLRRNKAATLINILGLSLSIACSIFVYAFIHHEKSFDSFHENSDNTYRLVSDIKTANGPVYEGNSSFAAATALRADFPDLKYVTQVYVEGQARLSVTGDKKTTEKFVEKGVAFADEYFLEVFDFTAITKSGKKLLSSPDEVIITKKLADKYFDPSHQEDYQALLGRTIEVNNKPYKISAILDDVPYNTNIHFNVLLPIKAFESLNKGIMRDWKEIRWMSNTFITLPEAYSAASVESSLISFKTKYLDAEHAKKISFHLQPIKEVHTDNKYGGTVYSSPKILIIAFTVLGIIVLLTACINFINLSTAQALKRAKEIAIRKTLGCSKLELGSKFLCETILIVTLASMLGLFIAYEFIKAFNKYISVVIDSGIALDISVVFFLLGLILTVSLLAGLYPAKVLANFQPTQALKPGMPGGKNGFAGRFSLRKALVVVQFTISQILIIGTIIVAMQIRHINTMDLGYKEAGVLVLEMPGNNPAKQAVFRNELKSLPQVQHVSFSSSPPIATNGLMSNVRLPAKSKNDKIPCERKIVDPFFLPTFGLKLLAGRNLSDNDSVNLLKETSRYNVLINEKGLSDLGFKSPQDALGKLILVSEAQQATVVGVVKDFFNVTPDDEIKPCLLVYDTNVGWVANIKFNSHSPSEATLNAIEKSWEEIYPDGAYQATTLEDFVRRRASFVIQDIMLKAFKIFVFLSIVIGCVGLYGLISYLAIQRQKEIGVRKVLGSTVSQIVGLFSGEFARLVIIAFIISAPIAYMVMKMWLQTFAHRISIHPGYLIMALMISITIAGLTIGSQVVRAARVNPVKTLRAE